MRIDHFCNPDVRSLHKVGRDVSHPEGKIDEFDIVESFKNHFFFYCRMQKVAMAHVEN